MTTEQTRAVQVCEGNGIDYGKFVTIICDDFQLYGSNDMIHIIGPSRQSRDKLSDFILKPPQERMSMKAYVAHNIFHHVVYRRLRRIQLDQSSKGFMLWWKD